MLNHNFNRYLLNTPVKFFKSPLLIGDKEVLRGLAKTCFALRSKSLTDLSVGPTTAPTTYDGNFHKKWFPLSSEGSTKSGQELRGARRNVRVLSYPLVSTSSHPASSAGPISPASPISSTPASTSSSECYGVLQVVIPVVESGGISMSAGSIVVTNSPPGTRVGEGEIGSDSVRLNDIKHLDDCCVEIARMISSVTMVHRHTASKDVRLLALEDAMRLFEGQKMDHAAITERWKHQAMSWRSLTHMIATLLARANECSDFPTAVRHMDLHASSWSSLLRTHAGISFLVRNAMTGDRIVFPWAATVTYSTTPVRAHAYAHAHTHIQAHAHTHVDNHASPTSRPTNTQVIPLDKDGTVVAEIQYNDSDPLFESAHPSKPTNTTTTTTTTTNNNNIIELGADASTELPSTGPSELVDLFCGMLQSIRTLHEGKQRQNSAISLPPPSSSSSSSSSMVTPTRAGSTSSVASASVYGWKPHHPGILFSPHNTPYLSLPYTITQCRRIITVHRK